MFSICLADCCLSLEFHSAAFWWAVEVASQGQELWCQCHTALSLCTFSPAHEIQQGSAVLQAQHQFSTADVRSCTQQGLPRVCPAGSAQRSRKALSAQQGELKASVRGKSCKVPQVLCKLLKTCSVKISVLADTLCVHLRFGIFICIACVCPSNEN